MNICFKNIPFKASFSFLQENTPKQGFCHFSHGFTLNLTPNLDRIKKKPCFCTKSMFSDPNCKKHCPILLQKRPIFTRFFFFFFFFHAWVYQYIWVPPGSKPRSICQTMLFTHIRHCNGLFVSEHISIYFSDNNIGTPTCLMSETKTNKQNRIHLISQSEVLEYYSLTVKKLETCPLIHGWAKLRDLTDVLFYKI